MLLVEAIDWTVALLPVLLMIGLFVWLDVFKLMTVRETLARLLLGGLAAVAAYPLSGIFLDQLPIGFSNYSRFVAPWIEEALKALAIISLFRFNQIGFKLDAVISGFAVGAGFSIVENIIYLTRFPELDIFVWMVRGLGTAVMHGTTLALMAAIVHELAERETRERAGDFDFSPWWFVPGLLVAVAVHTLFNQFPEQPVLTMVCTVVAAPLVLLAILRFGSAEASDWLKTEQAMHREHLQILRQGRFPDDSNNRRVAALAARCDPQNRERIREYLEVHTALVLCAEETLMDQSRSADQVRSGDAAALFDRLETLRRALGRSLYAELQPLLPFSRNDLWEVSELRERIGQAKG